MPGCSSPPVTSASMQEPVAAGRVVGVVVEDLLERHLAVQLAVEGHEDRPQPAAGVGRRTRNRWPSAGGGADGVAWRCGRRRPRLGRARPGPTGRARPRSPGRRAAPGVRAWTAGRDAARLFSTSPPWASRWTSARTSSSAASAAVRSPRASRWSARLRTCRASRPGRRPRAGPGRSGRSAARAIRRGGGGPRRPWHGSDRR